MKTPKNKTKKVLVMVAILATTVISNYADTRTASLCDRVIPALIKVESHGNDFVVGDRHMQDKAYGPLQIRKPCVEDVNRRFGTKYRPEDMLGNRSLSLTVCRQYLKMYATRERLGREPTEQDLARIWNGGPNGFKKQSTLGYWSKVEDVLAKVK